MKLRRVFDDQVDETLAEELRNAALSADCPLPLSPARAVDELLRFAAAHNLADRPVRGKVNHSLRVCALAYELARGQSEVDASEAFLAGLTHDIGRFPQWAMFGNFIDAQTCDHGELSAELLGTFGYLGRYLGASQERNTMAPEYAGRPARVEDLPAPAREACTRVVSAIRVHNGLSLPKGLDARTRSLAVLLRDADKCDILHLFAAREAAMATEEVEGTVSAEILDAIAEKRTADRTKISTPADRALMKACIAFGLTLLAARAYVREGSFVEQYLSSIGFRDGHAQEVADAMAVAWRSA